MKKLLGLGSAAALFVALVVGCDQQTGVKKVERVETPSGETTVTTEKKVEASGDHRTDAPKDDATKK